MRLLRLAKHSSHLLRINSTPDLVRKLISSPKRWLSTSQPPQLRGDQGADRADVSSRHIIPNLATQPPALATEVEVTKTSHQLPKARVTSYCHHSVELILVDCLYAIAALDNIIPNRELPEQAQRFEVRAPSLRADDASNENLASWAQRCQYSNADLSMLLRHLGIAIAVNLLVGLKPTLRDYALDSSSGFCRAMPSTDTCTGNAPVFVTSPTIALELGFKLDLAMEPHYRFIHNNVFPHFRTLLQKELDSSDIEDFYLAIAKLPDEKIVFLTRPYTQKLREQVYSRLLALRNICNSHMRHLSLELSSSYVREHAQWSGVNQVIR